MQEKLLVYFNLLDKNSIIKNLLYETKVFSISSSDVILLTNRVCCVNIKDIVVSIMSNGTVNYGKEDGVMLFTNPYFEEVYCV
jgi:hypothetical protein